jgi:chromosome segregation protein
MSAAALFEEAAGVGLYRVRREEALKRLETTMRNLERVLDIMSELEPRLRSLERQAKRANEYHSRPGGPEGHPAGVVRLSLAPRPAGTDRSREVVRGQEVRVNEARELHAKAQEAYNTFRERLSGLRAQLNAWHRQSAELHTSAKKSAASWRFSRNGGGRLLTAQSSVLADKDRTSDEERVAHERLAEIEQEVLRLQAN